MHAQLDPLCIICQCRMWWAQTHSIAEKFLWCSRSISSTVASVLVGPGFDSQPPLHTAIRFNALAQHVIMLRSQH